MSKQPIIQKLEEKHLKKDLPEFHIGDTIQVHTRIVEGGKERIQVFAGTVISRKGTGIAETFAMHRVAYGEGMERQFYLHSPMIAKIVVVRKGKVRRAKLYYLRGTSGKAAKVKEKRVGGGKKNKQPSAKEVVKEPVAQVKEENPPQE